jgi:hypothetical protein
VDWIHLAKKKNGVQWQCVVNTVMNLRETYEARNFWTERPSASQEPQHII